MYILFHRLQNGTSDLILGFRGGGVGSFIGTLEDALSPHDIWI